jgi:hypothetical protein
MHGIKVVGAFHEPWLVWSSAFRRLERLGPAEAGTPSCRDVAVKPAKHLASKSTPRQGCAMRPIPNRRQDRALFRHKSTGQIEHASRGELKTGLKYSSKSTHLSNLCRP